MQKVHSLRDYKGRPLYAAMGAYVPLMPALSFKRGLPGMLERTALKLQRLLPKKISPKTNMLEQIEREMVKAGLATIQAAFLYDTGWYKRTHWIGAVETGKGRYFVKVYAQPEDVLFEERHHAFIREHFSGPFVTVPAVVAQNGVLATPIMARSRDVNSDDHIEEKLLQINEEFLKKPGMCKAPREMIPLDLRTLVHGSEHQERIKRALSWVQARGSAVPLVPVHGDATSWNMFVSADEKIVLIDYERAGWHVAYYDVFHFILQNAALLPRHQGLKRLILNKNWYLREKMEEALVLYLLDQLSFDLHEAAIGGYNRKHFQRLIRSKLEWLDEMIGHG